jgi:hypothetical protein
MVDVRNVPYYSGKALQGLVNSAETLSKFPFAAGKLGSQLIQQPPKKEMFMDAIENITPGSWSENLGLTSLVEGMGEKRPKDAQTVGGILSLGTEIAVPTGGAFKAGQFLLSKASKAMGKVKDGKTLNKLVEDKISDSGQSRRDFMSLVGTGGLMVALKSIGLGGILKGATKKLDDIEIQVRGDADYEYIDEAWSGGTWANVYFKALTKKGQKILDDLVKKGDTGDTLQSNVEEGKDLLTSLTKQDGLYVPGGGSEEAAWIVEKIIAKHNPNWRLNTATTQIYNPATKSFAHPKGSIEGAYETTKSYSGKNLNKKTIMKEADDLIASEPSPYHSGIEVHDEFLDDILNQVEYKKAEGGRIGLDTGGPPISKIELLRLSGVDAPVGTTGTQGPTTSLGIGFENMNVDLTEPRPSGIKRSWNYNDIENLKNELTGGRDRNLNPWIGIEHARPSEDYTVGDDFQGTRFGASYAPETDEWHTGFEWKKNIDFNKMLNRKRRRRADGGLTKTIPPERGPDPQGLPSALYNGIMRPRSY